MARRLIYVGPDDDVSDLAGKVQAADPGDDVGLVVPAGAQAFQTTLNLRLLRSVAMKRGLTTSLITPDARVQELARGVGIGVYSSEAAYDGGVPVAARRPGQALFRDSEAPPRPVAPFLPRAGAPGPEPDGSVPRTAPPSGAGGWPAPVSPPPGAGTFRDPALLAAAGVPPAPRESPWAAPAPPPGGLGTAGTESPPPASPIPPPGRSPWTTATQTAEWDQASPPWAAGRAPDAYAARAGGAAVEPPPQAAPPTRASAPPSRAAGGGAPPPPAPGGIRGLLRNRRALYGIGAGLVVVAIVLFLVLGTSATVTVTIAEQPLTVNPTIQGTSVTAQAGQPNYVLTKVISDTAMQTFQASPTGSQQVQAVAATTNLTLETTLQECSNGCSPILIAEGTAFATSDDSSLWEVTADTVVSFTGDGIPGSPTVPVTDVQPGTSGNSVAVGAIDACAPGEDLCNKNQILVTNLSAPTGGVNATTETVASASDITNWQEQIGQVETQLGQQADTDLQTKSGGERAAIDPGGNGKSITYTISPSTFPPATAGTVMAAETVTVTMNAEETLYNPASVQADVLADLKASTNLPSGDSLVPGQLSLNNLQIIEAGSDGTFALSVSGVDYYRPSIDLGQLRGQLTGRDPGSVAGIVRKQISDVQSVTVDETPLQLFFMPISSSRIQIVETFVARAPVSSSSSTG
jgi:hypothetical protein